MPINSPRPPSPKAPRHSTAAAWLIAGGVFLAAAVLWTLLVPWSVGGGFGEFWAVPVDLWHVLPQSRYVANGAVLYLYEAPATFVGGYPYPPLWLLVTAPAVAIGDLVGLVDNREFFMPYPTMMFALLAVTVFAGVVPLTVAARRLVTVAGVTVTWRFQALVAGVGFAAVGYYAHGEDLFLLALFFTALVALTQQRHALAALCLVAAVLTKQTAVAFIPILAVAVPAAQRRRFLRRVVVAPIAAVAPFALITPNAFLAAMGGANAWSAIGHQQLWVGAVYGGREALDTTIVRTLWLAATVAVSWMWRHRTAVADLVAVAAVVFLLRAAVFEPTSLSYYWAPAMILAVVWAALTGHNTRLAFGWAILIQLWHAIHALPEPLWWAGTYTAAAALWGPLLRSLGVPWRNPRSPGHRGEGRLVGAASRPDQETEQPMCHDPQPVTL